jgi:hypothetical protein
MQDFSLAQMLVALLVTGVFSVGSHSSDGAAGVCCSPLVAMARLAAVTHLAPVAMLPIPCCCCCYRRTWRWCG